MGAPRRIRGYDLKRFRRLWRDRSVKVRELAALFRCSPQTLWNTARRLGLAPRATGPVARTHDPRLDRSAIR